MPPSMALLKQRDKVQGEEEVREDAGMSTDLGRTKPKLDRGTILEAILVAHSICWH